MKIDKEYLEEKLRQLGSQNEKVIKQINELMVISHKIDGAIDTIKVLIQDLEKVEVIEDNKE